MRVQVFEGERYIFDNIICKVYHMAINPKEFS